MPVYWSELVSVFVVFWLDMCILAVEHKPNSVIFSYASASHPHVATLSHHYRAPSGPEPQLQQYSPPSGQHSQQYVPPSAVQRSYLSHSAAQNIPPALPSSAGQPYHPELYPVNVQQQGGHSQNDGMSHYDGRTPDILYQQPISSPTPIYDYDYTTVSPDRYESSTVVYHNHQPLDNHNYNPYSTTELPLDFDRYSLNDLSTVAPDLGYHSTPIYYNDRPPDDSPNIQPPSHDHPQGYDYSSTGLTHPTEPYHGVIENTYHHSLPSQHSHEQQLHDYTTTQPIYRNNNSPIIHYESPQNFPITGNPQPETNLTHPPRSYQYYNSDGPNFPDYQAPASPEYFDSSSFHPPRGGKTFSPLPSSSTLVYYEDENEYISTTPIIEFESVKEKLPPIEDYPPPKPGYITKPLKNSFNQEKKMERQEQRKRRPSKASDKSSVFHHTNDKVLQKPKYFAYSTDLLVNHDDTGGGIDQENQRDEINEEDDHDQKKMKKKDEKYAKGGGQEHHSDHEATAGDKGDKGYKSGHKHEEGKKGHHEKEDHKGKYVDEKGKKGKKEEEGGHYGENHKAEKGKKAAKYGESGEHKKGHSTKGEHNIHKMDEYMKKHEFYDEHHEGGDHEKMGGFMEAHAHKKGGKKKKGHHNGGHHQKHKGKKGHHERGYKLGHHKGHKDAKGYDGHFSKHKKYGKKGGSKKGKKWKYSKGHPPK